MTKMKIIQWLVSLLDDDCLIVRKERLNVIIHMTHKLPNSKIATLSLIRLDGCDLKTAMKVREELD